MNKEVSSLSTVFLRSGWTAWAAAGVLSLALASCGTSGQAPASAPKPSSAPAGSSSSTATIRVGLPVLDANWAPLYAAQDQGFFKKQGIDVKLYTFNGDAAVDQALAGNSVDVDVASLVGLIHLINAHQPVRAFWGGFNQAVFEWVSPTLTSMSQAKGATVGITTYGSLTDQLTRYALQQEGVDPSSVHFLQTGGSPSTISALKSHQITLGILSPPFSFMAANEGMHVVLKESQIIPAWPEQVLFAHQSYIQQNQDTLKKFLIGLAQGMEWVKAHPQGAAQVIEKHLKFSPEYALPTIQAITPGYSPQGEISQAGLTQFWNVMKASGVVKQPMPTQDWLDSSLLNTESTWLAPHLQGGS